ncbi:MAG: RluA family pseudouridine synthase [Pseudomonadales bacterium]|nr:RluA family pseudouridine synthase [Pseudomonadales bacterium]
MQEISVVYQDDDLLILNKPAGVVVNRAQTVATETIQDWIEKHVPEVAEKRYPEGWQKMIPNDFSDEYGTPEDIFAARTGIAHRLDKDTSGVFVCAKHPGALLSLLTQFRERTVQKRYTCLTHGKFALPQGEVNVPLGRKSNDRKAFAVVADGRPALTKYAVESFYPEIDEAALMSAAHLKKKPRLTMYQGFSLVSCWPKTGRTHQIRVHMAHLQHPLVGDSKYVGKKRARADELWCPRQFLHAAEIELTHPRTRARATFTAPLAEDLQAALEFLIPSL